MQSGQMHSFIREDAKLLPFHILIFRLFFCEQYEGEIHWQIVYIFYAHIMEQKIQETKLNVIEVQSPCLHHELKFSIPFDISLITALVFSS